MKAAQNICLVTGATSGIGMATAQKMAKKGFATVVVGRDPEKCEKVCRKIRRQAPGVSVSFLTADLSAQDEVRRLADQFLQRFDKLDVLVNNAGARFLNRHVTVDGHEMTFALNHLAAFLLTRLLARPLEKAGNARIINVSSGAHKGVEIDFSDPQHERCYHGKLAYQRSKLANLLFTYELAERMQGTGVTVNAMAPGGVMSNFSRNNGWLSWARHVTAHIVAGDLITPAKAAETIVYMATSPELEGVSGRYLFNRQPVASSEASYDRTSAKRLWEISTALTA
ncbi:MAG: SDR family oxidoreductase [Thermodesulfobacteriota bacterium]